MAPMEAAVQVAPKTIWAWWHNGKESLTPFLKACLDSWEVQHPGWDVVVLDMNNVWDYVTPAELPSTFLDISRRSLQSDLVRLAILAKYGGCYTDLSCLALTNVAEAHWRLLHEGGRTLVGYRAPHFIADFVSAWYLVAKAKEPVIVEWSRIFNEVMEGRTDDVDVHLHPFFEGLDLSEYHNQDQLDPSFNSPCWADYLVVNICLKAVLRNDPELRASFWRTSALVPEADAAQSPTLWSQCTRSPKGMVFPESERAKMRTLIEEDLGLFTRLRAVPFLKFFNSGSPFAHLTREQLHTCTGVIPRLVQQALTERRVWLVEKSLSQPIGKAQPALASSAPEQSGMAAACLPLPERTPLPPRVPPPSPYLLPERTAVATLVPNDFYAVGAICLARSLEQYGELLPGTAMLCLVPERECKSEMARRLQAEGWEVVGVEGFSQELYPHLHTDMEKPESLHGWLKLHLWSLPDRVRRPFDRILYINPDAFVLGSLYGRMYLRNDAPPAGGVCMCPDYDWRAGMAALGRRQIAMQANNAMEAVQAAADAAAAFKPGAYCNAGFILLRPCSTVYRQLLEAARNYRHRGMAEQDLLHDFFTMQGRTKVIGPEFNAQKWIRICAPELWARLELKIVHMDSSKPWALVKDTTSPGAVEYAVEAVFERENLQCADLVRLWHQVYSRKANPDHMMAVDTAAVSAVVTIAASAQAASVAVAATAAAAAATAAAAAAAAAAVAVVVKEDDAPLSRTTSRTAAATA